MFGLNMISECILSYPFIITQVTVITHSFMFQFNVLEQITWIRGVIFTFITIMYQYFMLRLNVSSQIIPLRCKILTLVTRIPHALVFTLNLPGQILLQSCFRFTLFTHILLPSCSESGHGRGTTCPTMIVRVLINSIQLLKKTTWCSEYQLVSDHLDRAMSLAARVTLCA